MHKQVDDVFKLLWATLASPESGHTHTRVHDRDPLPPRKAIWQGLRVCTARDGAVRCRAPPMFTLTHIQKHTH
eukprot:2467785-Karenia_brevis.AAC.1